jgi:hypothetical protein
MAYTGFVSSPKYTMSDRAETIEGNWTFGTTGGPQSFTANGTWTFENTIQGTAFRALWGDLAEIYECDENEVLIPGTVVRLGGKFEITKTKKNDRNVFGVISSKPGIVLNKKELKGAKIALVGRVPVRVIGKIKKFDKLTTSYIPGIAKKKTWLDTLLLKPTIGVALKTNTNENEKLVESAVKIKI